MTSTRPSLSSTDPKQWRYIAEGGANVVLSYAGGAAGASSAFSGQLIRVRKRKLASTPSPVDLKNPVDLDTDNAVYEKVDSSEFAQSVIKPLLKSVTDRHSYSETASFLVDQEQVDIDQGWLQTLDEALKESPLRPPERLGRDEVDDRCSQVVICEDLIGGENIVSVEIKPKWGFLPRPDHLSPATKATKTTFCRFCMHRYEKEAHKHPMQALDRHQTGYCPLDLFSQDHERVQKGLRALWHGWEASHGSANNLRLFVDGKRVEPHDDPGLARLRTLLVSVKTHEAPQSTLDMFVSLLTPALVDSGALVVLKFLQASLDHYDIEGLASIPQLSLDDENSTATIWSQPSIDEWKQWVERYLNRQEQQPKLQNIEDDPTHLRDVMLSYLMSATFKDCSMILRFKFGPPVHNSSTNSLDQQEDSSQALPALNRRTSSLSTRTMQAMPTVTVKLIDLDPKPLSKMKHWFELDQNIVESWQTMLDNHPLDGQGVRKCLDR
ncbi:hypothetical protein OIO90_000076 [Microbotryomycetes sp. JL221]|nr:hypothetical protein OIO90_000076 [Microbotryomycetes sp. JL221]